MFKMLEFGMELNALVFAWSLGTTVLPTLFLAGQFIYILKPEI